MPTISHLCITFVSSPIFYVFYNIVNRGGRYTNTSKYAIIFNQINNRKPQHGELAEPPDYKLQGTGFKSQARLSATHVPYLVITYMKMNWIYILTLSIYVIHLSKWPHAFWSGHYIRITELISLIIF